LRPLRPHSKRKSINSHKLAAIEDTAQLFHLCESNIFFVVDNMGYDVVKSENLVYILISLWSCKMVTVANWLTNWRRIADGLEDGVYEPITAHHGGVNYEVLRLSKFDEEIDGLKNVVQTTSSAFEDKTALLSHLTRDTGLIRVVTKKGRAWFVLEPGEEVLEWIAAVEGVSLAKLLSSSRAGVLWRRMAKAVKLEKRRRRLSEAQGQELKKQIIEAENEAIRLRLELSDVEGELARHHEND
jgi:hypothetical protein